MIGDLHCHSRISDGSMGLEELVAYAKRMGLDFLAVTDHDTMAGIKRAAVLCERYGVSLIPGLELSVLDKSRGRKAHILCYLPDKTVLIDAMCSKIINSRAKAGTQMLKNVMRFFPIIAENVLKFSQGSLCIYKQHLMCALMEAGYTGEMYGDLYRELFDEKNGSCYEPVEYPDVYDALRVVLSSGAIPVLAHPGVYQSFELAEELAEKKFRHNNICITCILVLFALASILLTVKLFQFGNAQGKDYLTVLSVILNIVLFAVPISFQIVVGKPLDAHNFISKWLQKMLSKKYKKYGYDKDEEERLQNEYNEVMGTLDELKERISERIPIGV
ncbi:MAG: PHP domain-containing protein [Ruminococcaceae bacterium]|nr:PHP domain-containing protein [Oscillospiraceae bacterium]